MYVPGQTIAMLSLWQRIVTAGMQTLDFNYTPRQLAILLDVYLVPPPHTVKILSERLDISKPAVCRAIDALSAQKLLKRKTDPCDKRNVLIQRTMKGAIYLSEFADIILREVRSDDQLTLEPAENTANSTEQETA